MTQISKSSLNKSKDSNNVKLLASLLFGSILVLVTLLGLSGSSQEDILSAAGVLEDPVKTAGTDQAHLRHGDDANKAQEGQQPQAKIEMKSGADNEGKGEPMGIQADPEKVFAEENLVPKDFVERPEHLHDNGSRKTLIFNRYKPAKSGGVIEDMMMAHAYAYHRRVEYGGSCGISFTKQGAHEKLLDAIGLKDELPFACPGDHHDDSVRKSLIPWEQYHGDDTRIWTPEYVEFVKTRVKYPPKVPDKYTIAVHIRRGDVTPCRPKNKGYDRYLPNKHFLTLIEKYYIPGARVVVFSQAKSFEPLDVFLEKGYELELDSEITDIWKTFIVSDVVIMSRSDFSMIPGIVARGTIVYTPFWHVPLRHWEIVDQETMKATDSETERLKQTCANQH